MPPSTNDRRGTYSSGSLIRNKLWFYGALHDQRSEENLIGFSKAPGPDREFFTADDEPGYDETIVTNQTIKTTYQATPAYKVVGFFQRNEKIQPNGQSAGRFEPFPATYDYRFPTRATKADLTGTPNDRVLFNLMFGRQCDNAIKYSDQTRSLRISGRANAVGVHIEVSDRGAGIPPDDLPHVFEKFYRGRDGKPGGSGLGLTIARRIIRDHGGGIDIRRALTESPKRTAIIIVTAKTQKEQKIQGLELGADDYVTKPFALDELLARVHAVLRRAQPAPDELVLGDIVIDFRRTRAMRGTVELSLTDREFAVLRRLAERIGQAVSRDELLRVVWGYRDAPMTRTVDNLIARLRRKIEPDPRHPSYIRTAHGDGYRLTVR